MEAQPKSGESRVARKPGHAVVLVHVVAMGGAAAAIALTNHWNTWDPRPLAVIATFTVVSGLTYVESGSARVKVSGTPLGLMLAAVLLGGGPAAIVGMLTIALVWLRSREAGHYFRNNLVTFTWYALAGALFFHLTISAFHIGPQSLGYYLLVFPAFVIALGLNFLGVVGYQCYLDGSSLWQKVRDVLVPVLSAELFSALLTMASVYLAVHLGMTGIALLGLTFVIFQYLVGELLKSKHRSQELHRLATTDELTGLPNRERFRAQLEQEIAAAAQTGKPFAVMLMDLDHFKEINDTLGHHYGDILLRELGPRLARSVGPAGLVARLGGDEFGVLAGRRTDDPEQLDELAGKFLACIEQPFVVDELALEVGASVGIARFPIDGTDAHTLLRRADVAMYTAKETQSGCKLYSAEQDTHSMRRLSVLSDFRRALAAEEIVVHYQPIVDLAALRVRGAEGLVRWQHPELGLLAPGSFIQTVEQTGLIGPLTRYVLDRSIAQCAQWRRSGRDLSVAVNLSVRNLLDRELPKEIERMLDSCSLPPEALQLEITESMIMSDPDRALAIVTRLSDLGVRLSVDDFGTGYSSLANLRRLPIDELKIDRSFVTPMLSDESDLIIVRSTINLAHDLGLRIVAEGVEDEPTLAHLALLGCDLAQGYHVSRPMPSDAFADWMGRANALLAAALAA
ncbi:MAG TPA: EAL domain-containing protein [Solirubrobacteraceae bacterium]|nr:EAL domain-containing protein [Solirubrobacteraceae bacterium]